MRVPAGKSKDRFGQPMTMKLKGKVEPFPKDEPAASWRRVAPLDRHRQAALRLRRQLLHRPGLGFGRRVEAEARHQHGQRDDRLLHGEAGADADARTGAERQVLEAVDLVAVLRDGSAPA